EHVLLPENHLWNIGVEDAWMRSGIELGAGKLTYVGSKERVTQLNRYFDVESYLKERAKAEKAKAKDKGQDRKKADSKSDLPIEYEVYQAPQRGEDNRHKCVITYMATGDYSVSVGSNRVLDSGSYFRSRLTIDREYSLMNKALAKSEQPMRHGYSFIPFDSEEHSSNLWNFQGSLMFVEPIPEYHYSLFGLGIDPNRVEMAISGSVYHPGIIELMRHADQDKKVVGVSAPDTEKLGLVKRIFNFSQPKMFSEGGALPLARQVSYFESRTKSHAAFVFRAREDAEHPIQVVFPFVNAKKSLSFDFVKGPYDVEIAQINDKNQLKDEFIGQAVFLSRGLLNEKNWNKLKLASNQYPLLSTSEYSFKQVLKTSEWSSQAASVLENTEFAAPVTELLNSISSLSASTDITKIRDSLYMIRTQPIPNDKVLLLNLAAITATIQKIIIGIGLAEENVTIGQLAQKVVDRFKASRLKLGDFTEFAGTLKFDIIVHAGLYTIALAKVGVKRLNFALQYPPDADQIVALEKDYRKYLKSQQRVVDKAGSQPNDRAAIELLEKIFEERLFYGKERQRLQQVVEALNLGTIDVNARAGLPFYMKLPYWLRVTVQTLKIPELVEWTKKTKESLLDSSWLATVKSWFSKPSDSVSKLALWFIGLIAIIAVGYGVSQLSLPTTIGSNQFHRSSESKITEAITNQNQSQVSVTDDDVKKNYQIKS
ncbi:MAG: hypothetical protein H3C43_11625, partial [Leptonema sp. (in: Bacteria)]|nr:hypothetical protein [Leptonema sp. (in: bacteria)]